MVLLQWSWVGAGFAAPPDPGHDGQPLVGSTTIDVPR
jgi:hypothetical protein